MEFKKNDDYFRHENLVNTSISHKNSNVNVEKLSKTYKNSDKSGSENTQSKKTSKNTQSKYCHN